MIRRCTIAAALLFAAGAAFAQARPAPGLWELSFQMKGDNPEMAEKMARAQREMAAMPPEQRKMVEQMTSQGGVKLGSEGKPTTVQVCMTAEMVAREQMPMDGRCTQNGVHKSGSTVRFAFACNGERPTTGEGEYTFSGDKAYSGRSRIDTVINGKPERIEVENSGRWLGPDCGTRPRS